MIIARQIAHANRELITDTTGNVKTQAGEVLESDRFNECKCLQFKLPEKPIRYAYGTVGTHKKVRKSAKTMG